MAEQDDFEDESFDVEEFTSSSSSTEDSLFLFDGTKVSDPKTHRIKKYDFTNPIVLSDADLEKLKSHCEQFIYYLSGHLSMFLRTEFNLEMVDLNAELYSSFVDSIPSPSCVTLFKINELNGVSLLDVNSHLSATVVDKILGGRGSTNPEERGLTEIEKALVEDFNLIILEEWCKQWSSFKKLSPGIIGTETTGRFLQTSPSDAMILILTMEASFGDVSGPIRIAVPYYTLEPVLTSLLGQKPSSEASKSAKSLKWHDVYDNIPVDVSAQWDAFELSVRDLLNLEIGDIVEINPEIVSRTKIRIEGKTCFVGEIGIENERVAFQVNESVTEGLKLLL